jgi:hypothetical protein
MHKMPQMKALLELHVYSQRGGVEVGEGGNLNK